MGSLSYSLFAENYCGAVPASAQLADGSLEFGPPLSTTQLLDSAVSKSTRRLPYPERR